MDEEHGGPVGIAPLANVYAKLGVSGKAGRPAAAARFSELRGASVSDRG